MAGRDGAFARHPSGTEPMRQTVSARVCFLTAQSHRKRKMEAPTARGGAAVNLRCIMPMALSAQAGRPGPPPCALWLLGGGVCVETQQVRGCVPGGFDFGRGGCGNPLSPPFREGQVRLESGVDASMDVSELRPI